MAFLDFNGLSHFLDKIKTIFVSSSLKGAANGIAELDANGKVPSAQLPSFVDDVLEYTSKSSFPATGEAGKIYVALDNNKTYRWSGSAYVEISASLALGETSSTAYRGDRGKAAYTHAVTNKGAAFSAGLYKITTNSEGHVTEAASVAKADITALGIPGSDTTYSDATQSTHGLMSTTDKVKLDGIAGENLYYVVGPSTDTTAGTWTGTIEGLTAYYDGLTLLYVPAIKGASTTTLNINGLGAKTCYQTNTTKLTTHYAVGTPILFTYKDNYWRRADYDANSNTIPSAYCETAAATAAKVASCTAYAALANSYLHVLIRYANTAESAITLNINSIGAKPIYINGTASSASNCTLPAGTYIVYYNGTNFYFRTDGKLTANITGDAGTVNGKTVAVNVPSDAKFTDTTYESKAAASGGTDVSLVTTGEKYTWNNKGAGSVTKIKMNGTEKSPTSGVVDLGTVITDVSGKADKSATVSTVAYDSTNKKLTKTINGTTSDIVTASTLKTAMALNNVENKSSATIRGEITSSNVTTALGFTPYDSANPNGYTSNVGTVTKVKVNGTEKSPSSGVVDIGTLLTAHQTIKQDGITGATINRFGTCSTDAATAAKTVSITTGTFSLEAGVIIAVKFSNKNTASTPTLAVNSTAAKNIFVNGAQITTGANKGTLAGTVIFIYDGTQYHIIGNYDTTANNAVTQTATTTNATYEVLFSVSADNETKTEGARKTNTLTYNPSTKAFTTGGTVDGLTLTPQTTGFKVSGGTTSKTLTVGADYTLGAACAKGVTDNSSSTAVTSTDTNLITGRTLYYAGYTKNTGTVTKVKVNGTEKSPSSGVVDIGTVVTDVSDKADKSATVSTVAYDSTNKKLTKTINGTTSDIVTASTLKTAMALNNVENKSSATIRGELTSSNVTTALGFTPYNSTNPNGYTTNTGTITEVKANGTSIATSGAANIPAASTSAYGVTKLSNSTSSTSQVLAATPKAVKEAYDLAASKGKVLEITANAVSSLPFTIDSTVDANATKITATMVVVNSILGDPSVQETDWTITTAAGSLTITGTMTASSTTSITLHLLPKDE